MSRRHAEGDRGQIVRFSAHKSTQNKNSETAPCKSRVWDWGLCFRQRLQQDTHCAANSAHSAKSCCGHRKRHERNKKKPLRHRRRTVRLSGCEINAIKGVKTPPRQCGATVQHELLKQLDRLQPKFSGTQDTLRTTFIDKTKTLRQLRSGGTITQAAAPGSPLERGKYSHDS